MKTKTIALLAIPTLIAISTLSLAHSDNGQSGWGKKHSGEGQYKNHGDQRNSQLMLKKMTEKLALTEQQQTDIKALLEKQKMASDVGKDSRQALHEALRNLDVKAADYDQQLTAIKEQAGLKAQGKIDNMMAMKRGMAAILTPEQLAKMQQMKMKKPGMHHRN